MPSTAHLERATDLLGTRRAARRAAATPLGAHEFVEGGIPGAALSALLEHVTTLPAQAVLAAVGISARTRARINADPGRALSVDQGGRLWRFAEVLARATEVFGTQAAAEAWLMQPALALDGRCPLNLITTPPGARLVDDLLGRLEYGVYT